MASREKYIFPMLFGAFHDTPRTTYIRIELGNNPKSGDFVEYIIQYSLLPSDGKLFKADFISKCVELSFLTFTLSRGLLET